MFKYELHSHCSNASRCGCNDVFEMLDMYKQRGYAGLVLTDHFFGGNSCWRDENVWEWNERVKLFSEVYYKAFKYGKNIGIDVFFGLENRTGGREQLTYGVDERFLLQNPDIHTLPPENYCALVRKYGGLTSCAHPFRIASYIDSSLDTYAEFCDCVEVFNYGNQERKWDKQALEFALSLGKFMTSGSDAHSTEGAGHAGIATIERITNNAELVSALKSDKTALIINDDIVTKDKLSEYYSQWK